MSSAKVSAGPPLSRVVEVHAMTGGGSKSARPGSLEMEEETQSVSGRMKSINAGSTRLCMVFLIYLFS